jgi:hypothetical protein
LRIDRPCTELAKDVAAHGFEKIELLTTHFIEHGWPDILKVQVTNP